MIALLLSFQLTLAAADPDLTVLQTQDGVAPSQLLSKWLQEQVHAALDARSERYESLKTAEQLAEYQQSMRSFFLKQLGPFPERTPLNAQVVGTLTGDRHRVEKIVFESQPNHHVTAVLYLPESQPPYPGVVIPCGHSNNGKAAEPYQRIGILLAQNGIAAMCYDPIGQGERYQVPDEQGKPQYSTTLEHTLMGVGSVILGTNTAKYRIYDGMRAIDYLVSRPDIDSEKIGCTGNSGGGTLTSYLMALDDRIVCAAPSCYLTSFRRLIDTIGPQDAEQNIHGQIAFGMDHAEYILMRAPKPTLMCCATQDFFDIQGSWDTFRQAKRFYTRMGFSERVSLVETDAKHGFSTELRVGATRWMRRWLLGIDDAITETDFPVWSDEQLQCTPTGQVMSLSGERSVFDLNRDLEETLKAQRQAHWSEKKPDELIQEVREFVGIAKWEELPELTQESKGVVEADSYQIAKLKLTAAQGRVVPALLYTPKKPATGAVLYVHGQSKTASGGDGVSALEFVKQGKIVLAPDLSGIGETEPKSGNASWTPLFGPDWKEIFLAYLLDRSMVELRTEEILQCAKFLQSQDFGDDRRVELFAVGEATVPALHAAAFERQAFNSVKLIGALESWTELLQTELTYNQLVNTVHGALQLYDLSDLQQYVERADAKK